MDEKDIKGEALYNDNRLHAICVYAATQGYIHGAFPKTVKKVFREFKRWLLIKEFESLDELENDVYKRFGILSVDNPDRVCDTDLQHLKDMHDELEKRDKEKGISGDQQKNS
jgi:hypothetical protein